MDAPEQRLALLLHFLGKTHDLGSATREAEAAMVFVAQGRAIPKPPLTPWDQSRVDLFDAFCSLNLDQRRDLASLARSWATANRAESAVADAADPQDHDAG